MQTTVQILTWTITCSLIILLTFASFIYYLLGIYKNKQIEFITSLRIQSMKNEKEVINARVEVEEETFQNISREIHDNVNQLLTLSKISLSTYNNPTREELDEKISLSKELITSAIRELSNLSRRLSAEAIIDLGLIETLRVEIERLNKLSDISILLDLPEEIPLLDIESQLLIFRIFQEAVRNSIVHGKSTSILISLKIHNEVVELNIKDNGIGFDVENFISQNQNTHNGIRNMKKRVHLLNGNFSISSTIGSGTEVILKIPLNHF